MRSASSSGRKCPSLRVGEGVDHAGERTIHDPRQQLAEPLLGHAGRQVVDRHDPRGVDRLAADGRKLGRCELRPPPALGDLPRHDDLVALLKPTLDEAAPEPDRLRAATCVGELRDDPLRPPPESRFDADRLDAHTGRLLLVGDQLAERPEVAEVVIPERQVPERLAWRGDAELRERGHAARQLGHCAADRYVQLLGRQRRHALGTVRREANSRITSYAGTYPSSVWTTRTGPVSASGA